MTHQSLTYFCVRSDTQQIFDTLSNFPSVEYLESYAALFHCPILVIEGQVIGEFQEREGYAR